MAQLMPTPMAEPAGTRVGDGGAGGQVDEGLAEADARQRHDHEGTRAKRFQIADDGEGHPGAGREIVEVAEDVSVVGQLGEQEAEDGDDEDEA